MATQVSSQLRPDAVTETIVHEYHLKGISIYETALRWGDGVAMMACQPTLDLHYRVQPSTMQAYWGMSGTDCGVDRLAVKPPNITFEGRAPNAREEVRILTCHFEPKLLNELAGAQINWSSAQVAQITSKFQNPDIERSMRRISVELSRPRPDSDLMIKTLCQLMAVDLARQFSQRSYGRNEGAKLSAARLRRIHELVYTPAVRIPAIIDLARDLDISVPHLRKLFKHTTGKSLSRYMTEARTAIARELLAETNQPLKMVAFLLGYSRQSSLTDRFQHITGELPSKFRGRMRRKPNLKGDRQGQGALGVPLQDNDGV